MNCILEVGPTIFDQKLGLTVSVNHTAVVSLPLPHFQIRPVHPGDTVANRVDEVVVVERSHLVRQQLPDIVVDE